ncbi:hypothetical protein BC830DRAFT_1173138 [Chytriomyces sp. MP71]|nr:hypothetical protein BC830DRAFT_1173138 [Chytriomyces sp. MP71]
MGVAMGAVVVGAASNLLQELGLGLVRAIAAKMERMVDGGSREQDVSEFLLNEPQQHGAEPDRSQQENETNALPAETRESGESIELAAPLPSPLPQRDSAKSLRHSLSENATFIYGHVTPHYSGYDEPFYGPSASYGADPRHHAYAPHRCDYTIDSCADPYYAAHYYSYAESHPALRYAHDHPPENVFHKYLADEHSKEEYSTEEYATNALAEPAVQDLYDPFASSYSDEVATNSESTLDRATTPVRGMQLPTPVDDKVAASGKPIVSFAAGMYRCNVDGCRKTYTSSSSLQYHQHHGHRIQKWEEGDERTRYECLDPCCQKSDTSVAGLKYHMKHGHDEMEGAFGGST